MAGVKRCSKCGLTKPVEDFVRDRTKSDGLYSSCRECASRWNAERRPVSWHIPETKECGDCKQVKPATAFYSNRARPEGLCLYCRPCMAKRSKAWHDANYERFRLQNNARSAKNNREKREWIYQLKAERGCFMCGERDPVCLEFHHRDMEGKRFTIGAHMLRQRKVLLAEIAKCDVVCANCHRRLHRTIPEYRVAPNQGRRFRRTEEEKRA